MCVSICSAGFFVGLRIFVFSNRFPFASWGRVQQKSLEVES